MCARFGSLCVLPWILFSQMSWDMSAVPVVTAASPFYEVPPEINDRGAVFNHGVKRGSREALRKIRYAHSVPILVETVESLDGERIDDAARRRARPLGRDGIYVLVARQERDVAVSFGRDQARGLLKDPDRAAIREAFLGPIQAGDADRGLEDGVRMIGTTLAGAAAVAKPKSNAGDMMLPATILFALGAVLLALQMGTSDEDRSEPRRNASPPPLEPLLRGGHSHGPDRAVGRL